MILEMLQFAYSEMMLTLIELLIFVLPAEAQYQSCADGGVGPCIAGGCPMPTTQTCITTGPGTEMCCENSQIIAAPVPTTTAAPCQDLVNPRTGVSDCPNVAYLCNNAVYYNLMTQQCPRTCNRCPGTAATTVAPAMCNDLVNPRTGVSDCPNVAYLCNNAIYYNLMTQQCPRTCNRCPGQNTAYQGVISGGTATACQDLVDSRTGISNCAQVATYCRNPRYVALMRQQCPRTCGYCP